MATLKEISYSILSQCYNFNISDDIDVDLDWIYYQVAVFRNLILFQEMKNKSDIDIYKYYSKINCLKLECTDAAECCEIKTDCNIFKVVLPTKIHNPNHVNVSLVGFRDFFIYKTPNLINITKHRRIKIGLGYWYFIDNAIYIVSEDKDLEYISIYGIFENPEKLQEINNCEDKPCFLIGETEYPIEEKYIPLVEQYVVNLLRQSLNNIKDYANNAIDDAINMIRGDMQQLNKQINQNQ